MYAVIRSGSKQYRVAPGDTIRVETLEGKIGSKVTFDEILAVHTDEKKFLTGDAAGKAAITGKIVRHGRGPKVTVFKYRKTKQYKISRGHRQNYTAVEIGDIKLQ